MSSTVSVYDNEFSLLVKWAQNWYDFSVNFGVTGLTPPSLNDTKDTLLKKVCYYTARFLDAHPAA